MSRAQATLTTYGVLKVFTNDSPPTMYALDLRAVIYGLKKYTKLLRIRGLGSAKECYL